MNIKVDFDNIVVKEDKNDFNVKVLMLKGEKGDQGDGEPNVIEKVQVNGTDLPVTNKTVNVPVPIVDSSISSSSTNPVQNSVIYNALSNKADTSEFNNYYEISEIDTLLLQRPYYFDNVAEMKSYNLKDGDYAITKGYYTANDGGASNYEIVDDDTLIEDNGLIHELTNGLKAKLICQQKVNALQLGCKTDGSDNSTILNNYFNKGNEKGIYFPKGEYYVNNEIDTIGNVEMDKEAYLIALGIMDCIVHINKNLIIPSGSFANKYPKNQQLNINVDGNKLAKTGIRTDKLHWAKLVLTAKNCTEYGVYTRYDSTKGHAENTFDIQTMYDTSDGSNTATGIYIGGSDDIYNNIVSINTKYCCEIHGGDNSINTIHGWLVNSNLWQGSVLLKIGGNKNHIENLIVDTYETGIAFADEFNVSSSIFNYYIDYMYGLINTSFIPEELRSSYKIWDFTGLTGNARNNSTLHITDYKGNDQYTAKIVLGGDGICPWNTKLGYTDDYSTPKWEYSLDYCPEGSFGFLGNANVSGKPQYVSAGNFVLRTVNSSYGKEQELVQVGLNRTTGATTYNTQTLQPTGNFTSYYKRVVSKFSVGNNPWGLYASYYVQVPTE